MSGVLVDIPAQGGYATLVSMTDDTTSLYTSVGGGTIGAGTHAHVAQATHELLRAVHRQIDLFPLGDDDSLPDPGLVRFHVLTPEGRRAADVPEPSFWGKAEHALMPVIAAAQNVLSRMREASPP